MPGTGPIEPGGRRRILDPRMVRTGVVHYLVLNDLYAGAVRGIDEFAQLRDGAEVFLDRVEVLRVVAMKSGARFVFLEFYLVEPIVVVVPGRQPDSSDTQLLQIRQPIDDALEVAAM